jgi:hypothetical protein
MLAPFPSLTPTPIQCHSLLVGVGCSSPGVQESLVRRFDLDFAGYGDAGFDIATALVAVVAVACEHSYLVVLLVFADFAGGEASVCVAHVAGAVNPGVVYFETGLHQECCQYYPDCCHSRGLDAASSVGFVSCHMLASD